MSNKDTNKLFPFSNPDFGRETLIDYINKSDEPVNKREIAKKFDLRGDDKVPLKLMLKELVEEGLLEKTRGKRYLMASDLPAIMVVEVSEIDINGEVILAPLNWDKPTEAPKIYLTEDKSGDAPAVGARMLVRLAKQKDGSVYHARVMRKLETQRAEFMGVLSTKAAPNGYAGIITPTDKKAKFQYGVLGGKLKGAKDGDIVLAHALNATRLGLKSAEIKEVIGDLTQPKSISLIAIHTHDLPFHFPDEVQRDALKIEKMGVPTLDGRVDLRDVPLVTIDGDDARDFDDAVWAEQDDDPENEGGWNMMIAIADVSAYVTTGSALDKEAYRRSNSTYFPDRVVPMLPEALSNGLCSLRPNEDRACLAVSIKLSRYGQILKFKFIRGLMRSAARLTYDQVQAMRDGKTFEDIPDFVKSDIIPPLYGAYKTLAKARVKRGTLELDLPERRIYIGETGRVTHIVPRDRFDSHKLIEEFMITANVAAAMALEKAKAPCMYRVHEEPADDRVEQLRDFLGTFGYNLAKGQGLKPIHFNTILNKAREKPESQLVSTVILRSQSQAYYSPQNKGHFGLSLEKYAHFTSPIRRYSDLIVHRSLIKALKLGSDGLEESQASKMEQIADQISTNERRSSVAERDSTDRYVASYLSNQIGATFAGRINGVTRFGLFISLNETGADGIVPMRSLVDDYYEHDEEHHQLRGRHSGRRLQLGQPVEVRLVEANAISGSMVFQLMSANDVPLPQTSNRKGTGRGAGHSRRERLAKTDLKKSKSRKRQTQGAKKKAHKRHKKNK